MINRIDLNTSNRSNNNIRPKNEVSFGTKIGPGLKKLVAEHLDEFSAEAKKGLKEMQADGKERKLDYKCAYGDSQTNEDGWQKVQLQLFPDEKFKKSYRKLFKFNLWGNVLHPVELNDSDIKIGEFIQKIQPFFSAKALDKFEAKILADQAANIASNKAYLKAEKVKAKKTKTNAAAKARELKDLFGGKNIKSKSKATTKLNGKEDILGYEGKEY